MDYKVLVVVAAFWWLDGLATILNLVNIPGITQYLEEDKSSSIS